MQRYDMESVDRGDRIYVEMVERWNGIYVMAEDAESSIEDYKDLCTEYEERIKDLKEQIEELEGLLEDAQKEGR